MLKNLKMKSLRSQELSEYVSLRCCCTNSILPSKCSHAPIGCDVMDNGVHAHEIMQPNGNHNRELVSIGKVLNDCN